MKRTFLSAFIVVLVTLGAQPARACYHCKTTPGYPPECEAGPETGRTQCVAYHGCNFSGDNCGQGGGCFLGSALVETPSGLCPIEQLRPGDSIITVTEDGKRVAGVVEDVFKVVVDKFLIINGTTCVTGTHPFLTSEGWVEADDLSIGDKLVTAGTVDNAVVSIERQSKGVRAYNLRVSESHRFIVDGNVVHNKPPDPEG